MKILITILIVIGVVFGVYKLWEYWDKVSQEKELIQRAADGSDIQPQYLRGLDGDVEVYYNQAREKGPEAIGQFLDRFDKSPKFRDPKRAWIELDYIVSITGSDPAQARRRFQAVKERVQTNSVIYPRIRAMEKTYE